MKLSDIPNLLSGCTVPTENPVRDVIKKQRGKDFRTALTVALRNKKHGNPQENRDPDAKSGSPTDEERGTVDV